MSDAAKREARVLSAVGALFVVIAIAWAITGVIDTSDGIVRTTSRGETRLIGWPDEQSAFISATFLRYVFIAACFGTTGAGLIVAGLRRRGH